MHTPHKYSVCFCRGLRYKGTKPFLQPAPGPVDTSFLPAGQLLKCAWDAGVSVLLLLMNTKAFRILYSIFRLIFYQAALYIPP